MSTCTFCKEPIETIMINNLKICSNCGIECEDQDFIVSDYMHSSINFKQPVVVNKNVHDFMTFCDNITRKQHCKKVYAFLYLIKIGKIRVQEIRSCLECENKILISSAPSVLEEYFRL